MNPCELAAVAASIAIAIAKRTPDDNELLTISIIIDLISDNLDAIIADRVLLEKIVQSQKQNQNADVDFEFFRDERRFQFQRSNNPKQD